MSNVVSFPSAKRAAPEAPPHHTDVLSFTKKRRPKGGGINYWLIDRSGNYCEQIQRGKQLAGEYLSFIGEYPNVGNGYLLSDIVNSMIEGAQHGEGWTGVHLGFLHEVSRFAMAAATIYSPEDLGE